MDENSNHIQNQFDDIIAPPAPATFINRPLGRNIPLSQDDEPATPRQPRTHQRSLTALLPFRTSRTNSESPQRSPQRSPVKEKQDFDFMPTLTGDTHGQIKIADKSKGGLSGWFTGSSAPVAVGLPIDEFEETITMAPSLQSTRGTSQLRRRPTITALETAQHLPTKPMTASTSRFAFFSPKITAPVQHQIPAELSDDLLTLDIRSALFPAGENDPFSPSAFKNLLANAEGLLNKLQSAYKIRTISLQELAAEKEVQAEELEEAETRAMHLKMQLEDMAQRVMTHDEEMKKVVEALNKEKQARAEEKEAREKSISLIKLHTPSPAQEVSPQSEDLEVESRQRHRPWRHSDGTINSETSYESDIESGGAESVFSRSMSPSLASVSETSSTPEMGQAIFAKVVNIGPRKAVERPKPVQQRSTFQKILKGISATPEDESQTSRCKEEEDELGMADQGCRNCRGQQASVAWDTVGLLRAENKGLKGRVAELESGVDEALDLVNGYRLEHLDRSGRIS